MRDGQTAGTRDAAATTTSELIRLMVGRELNLDGGPREAARGEAILEVEQLTTTACAMFHSNCIAAKCSASQDSSAQDAASLGAALFGLDRILGGRIQSQGRTVSPRVRRAMLCAAASAWSPRTGAARG